METVIQAISSAIFGLAGAKTPERVTFWKARIREIEAEHLPSGSGIDDGTRVDLETSKPDKVVFLVAFHHMNEHGFYVGWSNHRVTVVPSFAFVMSMRVAGRNFQGVKDHIADTLREALEAPMPQQAAGKVAS